MNQRTKLTPSSAASKRAISSQVVEGLADLGRQRDDQRLLHSKIPQLIRLGLALIVAEDGELEVQIAVAVGDIGVVAIASTGMKSRWRSRKCWTRVLQTKLLPTPPLSPSTRWIQAIYRLLKLNED
jgi:hypothetical protein